MYRSRDDFDDLFDNSPTQKQRACLDRHNLDPHHELDLYQAAKTLGDFFSSRRALPPTARQKEILKQHGFWREGMTRGQAFDRIGTILHPRPGGGF